MGKKLFLLDGMALVYRAHFALIARPIFTSKGVNSSALYGFTQTLLEILREQQPTHIAVAFDTEKPTQRHIDFPEYKATRQEMPEDLSAALPHVRRMLEAFRIPVLTCDGFEADDLIGTLVRVAEKQGFFSYMVTPDKDFGQLVDEHTFLYKPSRMGEGVEVLGLPEIRARWGVQKPEQVIDILALMGDTSDNIPGVPGIGEKTAIKLISQFGTVEDLLARVAEVPGKMREKLEQHREQALLSKKLATIICDAPCNCDIEGLKLRPPDEEAVKAMLIEFEFNSIGKRLFGDDFKAGRGYAGPDAGGKPEAGGTRTKRAARSEAGAPSAELLEVQPRSRPANLTNLASVSHEYQVTRTAAERAALLERLAPAESLGFRLDLSTPDPKSAKLLGLAFSTQPHSAHYVPLPAAPAEAQDVLEAFRPIFTSSRHTLVGHDLKPYLLALKWHGIEVEAGLFDSMIAHALIEPDMRHSLDYVSEVYLGYTPMVKPEPGQAVEQELLPPTGDSTPDSDAACEGADLALRLREQLEPVLKQRGQERVFYEIELPLIRPLVDMEFEGIRIDAEILERFSAQLAKELDMNEREICRLAGTTFNLNSPRQLGQILFDVMKICEAPKKTRTGQYVTDEQTLAALAPDHEIVRRLLEHRAATKLKSTYADALPTAIWPRTGRVHTTYNQVLTATGRLNSNNPNLQNIPIRTERGQEIRRAFVPRDPEYRLLSADYSQIELRIIAALSQESGLLEAFKTGADVHAATAARVYGVPADGVTSEMRRKAKMVNYGIAYGISAFGLAQRLGIPRKEAAEIIDQYFAQFPGIARFMESTITFARRHGYVETVTGRRRYIRDINSSNNTVRSAAERNAINAPIQGTAADMIKVAMVRIHAEIKRHGLRSRMLLQVHDELVFDVHRDEEKVLCDLVTENMRKAIPLDVPIEVEAGAGENWLEAH